MSEAADLKRERIYIIILAAIQIAHILDFVIMMPLGPQFMRVFSISPAQFSTLVSAYTFSAGIVGFFGALYADHFDRKKFLIFNFTGFIIGTFMCAIAGGFHSLLIARIIAGAFGGILNACVLSLVADLIPFARRGKAMGVVMSSFSIASVMGIPVGLWVANKFHWHAAFYLICILSLIFWIGSFIFLPSVKVDGPKLGFVDNLKKFKVIIKNFDYLQCFTLTSVLGFGVFMTIPFIAPYMVKNVGLLESELPLIYLFGGAFTIISARLIGRLSDTQGSYKMFKILAIISCFPLIALTNLPQSPLWVALLVSTLFTMIGSGRFIPAMTLISAVSRPGDRGTFMSLENATRQFATGIASQLAGLIIGTTSAGLLTNFPIVGIVGVVTTILGIYIAFKIKTKHQLL
jgi:predicted MFS family arabinose efflux permease